MQTPILKTFFATLITSLVLMLSGCGSDESESGLEGVSSEAMFERSYSPSIGPENASVTIVEFFDPACEACRAFYPYVKEILNRHPEDVRLVIRNAAFHQGSETVIRLLEAARQQSVYLPVLENLLVKQGEWAAHHAPNIDRAWELAAEAGLDLDKARSILDSKEMNAMIAQEAADIRAFKIAQTPSFFVNTKPLTEHGPNELYALVLSQLEQAK